MEYVGLGRTKGEFIIGNYKRELIRKFGRKCWNCKKEILTGQDIILDHKIPVKVGGKDVIFDKENMWLLCEKCNNEKLSIDKTIIFEMIKKNFFNKGYLTCYKDEKECIDYYVYRFREIRAIRV